MIAMNNYKPLRNIFKEGKIKLLKELLKDRKQIVIKINHQLGTTVISLYISVLSVYFPTIRNNQSVMLDSESFKTIETYYMRQDFKEAGSLERFSSYVSYVFNQAGIQV